MQCCKLPAFIVGCVYRHPKALAVSFEYIETIFRLLSVKNKSLFILGDFNDNLLLKDSRLSKLITNNNLTQIIDKPTRVTPTSATLLDLVITNKPDLILTHNIVPQIIADHDLVSVQVDISKPKRQPVTKTFRHLGKYSQETFSSLLEQNSPAMNKIFLTDNVNDQVRIFTDVFTKTLDACAPFVTKVIRRPPAPWMSDDIRHAILVRNNVHNKLKGDRHNTALQEEYKKEKKLVTALIKNAKSSFHNKQFHDRRGNTAAT